MADLKWKTEKRKVKDLKLYPKNPRTITDDRMKKLVRSLDRMNLAEIPAIDKDNTVIAGNQRVKALIEMKRQDEEIDVRVPNRKLKKSEFEDYLLTSNLPTGEWDEDALKESFDEEFLEYVGFDMDYIEELFPGQPTEGNIGDDEVPEVDEKDVFIKTGGLYQLGRHRLLCGDATKREDVDRLMDGNISIACITDPPYSVNYEHQKRKKNSPTRAEKGDTYKDPEAKDVLSFIKIIPSDLLVMSYPINKHFHLLSDLTKDWDLLYDLVWVKHHFAFHMNRNYQPQHEPLLIFRRKGGKSVFNVPNNKSTIFEYDKPARNEEHPTKKPVGLYEELVTYQSNKNDLIYEPFCGSGTTLIACEKTNRICYMMEIDPYYCQVIIERWEKFTEGKAVKL